MTRPKGSQPRTPGKNRVNCPLLFVACTHVAVVCVACVEGSSARPSTRSMVYLFFRRSFPCAAAQRYIPHVLSVRFCSQREFISPLPLLSLPPSLLPSPVSVGLVLTLLSRSGKESRGLSELGSFEGPGPLSLCLKVFVLFDELAEVA